MGEELKRLFAIAVADPARNSSENLLGAAAADAKNKIQDLTKSDKGVIL